LYRLSHAAGGPPGSVIHLLDGLKNLNFEIHSVLLKINKAQPYAQHCALTYIQVLVMQDSLGPPPHATLTCSQLNA